MKKPFSEQFKHGDIICCNTFHDGKCMIVEEFKNDGYVCEDLIVDNQDWRAYDISLRSGAEYKWRLATDKDIVYYLERYVDVREKSIGYGMSLQMTDDTLIIKDCGTAAYLDANQAAKLRDYLNKYVIGG